MANLVLRTMYIDPEIDDTLRTEAFDTRTPKNDLLRRYLKLGMDVAQQRREAAIAAEKALAADRKAKPRAKKVPVAAIVVEKVVPAAKKTKQATTSTAPTKVVSKKSDVPRN